MDTVGCEVKVEGRIPGFPARGSASGLGSFLAMGDGPLRVVANGFLGPVGPVGPLELTGVRKLGALGEDASPLPERGSFLFRNDIWWDSGIYLDMLLVFCRFGARVYEYMEDDKDLE